MERITACNLSDVSNPITHQRSEDGFHIQNQSPELLSEDDMTSPIEKKTGDDGLGIRVECAVCNVRLGAQAMTMHLQGKPHLKKIEHFLMEDSKLSWCPICSVQLSSLKQAFSHCMSKQHCERLVKQQKDITAENTMKRKGRALDIYKALDIFKLTNKLKYNLHYKLNRFDTISRLPLPIHR